MSSSWATPKPAQPYKGPERPQPQRHPTKAPGNVAPEGQNQPKGDKGGKGNGKNGKNDVEGKSDGKGKGKRQVRPGARAAQEWDDYEASEQPDDGSVYDDYSPEDPEHERDICETPADEGYDDDRAYDGQGDLEGSEPSEHGEHIVKTIMAAKHKQKEEMERNCTKSCRSGRVRCRLDMQVW